MIARVQVGTSEYARHSAEETFYLRRLSRLARLAAPTGGGFATEQLLRHAIFATYVDCREHGLEAEAREILSETTHQQAVGVA